MNDNKLRWAIILACWLLLSLCFFRFGYELGREHAQETTEALVDVAINTTEVCLRLLRSYNPLDGDAE